MGIHFTSINSGSNGNCYYVGTDREAVLVDVGLSARETMLRMKSLGLSISNVKAIFISHEHQDHIKGLSVLSNQYELPVYMTEQTRRAAKLKLDRKRVFDFEAHQPISIGGLKIIGFPKSHDAIDPYSFVVQGLEKTVGVFTDLGVVCGNLKKYFGLCHAAFLEANYDSKMLDEGNYPQILKERIRGGLGHLSNEEAFGVLRDHRHKDLSHLQLAHLSKNNNHPNVVSKVFEPFADKIAIRIESRFTAMPVLSLEDGERVVGGGKMMQMKLF